MTTPSSAGPTYDAARGYLDQHDDDTARDHVERVEGCLGEYDGRHVWPMSARRG